MPPTQHIRAFFAVRYRLLYSLSVTTPAEHLFLVHVHAIKIGRLNLCRKDRSNWKLLSVCSRCLCRENPGSVTTAQLMPSESVVPKGCGYSWGKGNISETILRFQNPAFQIRTKTEGLQIPSLYLSQMLQLQADQATPFSFNRVCTLLWRLHWWSLQLTREGEKHHHVLFWGPSVLSLMWMCPTSPALSAALTSPSLLQPQSSLLLVNTPGFQGATMLHLKLLCDAGVFLSLSISKNIYPHSTSNCGWLSRIWKTKGFYTGPR